MVKLEIFDDWRKLRWRLGEGSDHPLRIFHEINHPAIGVPPIYGNLHIDGCRKKWKEIFGKMVSAG